MAVHNTWYERDGIAFCTITHDSGITGTAKLDPADAAALRLIGKRLRLMDSYGKLYVVGRFASHNQQLLHRWLMNPGKKQQIDHINGDSLDNRRCNMRVCTPSQNAQNTGPKGGRRYKNVYKSGDNKFYVMVTRYGFDTEEDAAACAARGRIAMHDDPSDLLPAPERVVA